MLIIRTGWRAVDRDVYYTYNQKNSPLEIKTNSVLGSDDKVHVLFDNADGAYAGGFVISFETPPLFGVEYCGQWIKHLSLPSKTEKVWRITQTTNSGIIGITLHCNNVEVANIVISETCTDDRWRLYYTRDREKIRFYKLSDTASDYYRAGKKYGASNNF